MRCTAHDRDPCSEPRCHVLAVCLAEVPAFNAVGSLQAFTRRGNYSLGIRFMGGGASTHPRRAIAEQVAGRLVAWMRGDGSLPCEACEGTGVRAYHGSGSCERCRGSGRAPGQHPLDAVMAYADRVAALELVLNQCPKHETELGVFSAGSSGNLFGPREDRWHPWRSVKNARVLRERGEYQHCGCRLAVDVNWATVAALLDRMEEHGIGLDVVHECAVIDPHGSHEGSAPAPSFLMSMPLRGLSHDVAEIANLRAQIQIAGGLDDEQIAQVIAGIRRVAESGEGSLLECHEWALRDAMERGMRGLLWWAGQSPGFGMGGHERIS